MNSSSLVDLVMMGFAGLFAACWGVGVVSIFPSFWEQFAVRKFRSSSFRGGWRWHSKEIEPIRLPAPAEFSLECAHGKVDESQEVLIRAHSPPPGMSPDFFSLIRIYSDSGRWRADFSYPFWATLQVRAWFSGMGVMITLLVLAEVFGTYVPPPESPESNSLLAIPFVFVAMTIFFILRYHRICKRDRANSEIALSETLEYLQEGGGRGN